jgi:hypothetical protein
MDTIYYELLERSESGIKADEFMVVGLIVQYQSKNLLGREDVAMDFELERTLYDDYLAFKNEN